MEVYRTDVSLAPEAFYGQFIGIMHTLNWHDQVINGTTAKFYINDTQYIDVSFSSSKFNLSIYNGETAVSNNMISNQNNSNASIYVNDDAMAICFTTGAYGTTLTTYSHTANIIIDKIDDDISMIYSFTNTGQTGSFVKVLNSFTNNLELYSPYFSQRSLANHTNVAQIAPYIDIVRGNTYENLYCVLVTPWMNTIVDKSGEKWLFTNGFAIPCGAEINYHYYE